MQQKIHFCLERWGILPNERKCISVRHFLWLATPSKTKSIRIPAQTDFSSEEHPHIIFSGGLTGSNRIPLKKTLSCQSDKIHLPKKSVKQNQQAWHSVVQIKDLTPTVLSLLGKNFPKTLVRIFLESPLNERDISKLK